MRNHGGRRTVANFKELGDLIQQTQASVQENPIIIPPPQAIIPEQQHEIITTPNNMEKPPQTPSTEIAHEQTEASPEVEKIVAAIKEAQTQGIISPEKAQEREAEVRAAAAQGAFQEALDIQDIVLHGVSGRATPEAPQPAQDSPNSPETPATQPEEAQGTSPENASAEATENPTEVSGTPEQKKRFEKTRAILNTIGGEVREKGKKLGPAWNQVEKFGNWYAKQPTGAKLAVAGVFFALAAGGAYMGGAVGAKMVFAGISGTKVQRLLGGLGTYIGMQAVLKNQIEGLGEERTTWQKYRHHALAGTLGIIVGGGYLMDAFKGAGEIFSGPAHHGVELSHPERVAELSKAHPNIAVEHGQTPAGAPSSAPEALGVPIAPANLDVQVKAGDTLWKILDEKLQANPQFAGMTEAQKAYTLDSITKGLSAEQLKEIGIQNANVIQAGQTLHLSGLLGQHDLLEKTMGKAATITQEHIAGVATHTPVTPEASVAHATPGAAVGGEVLSAAVSTEHAASFAQSYEHPYKEFTVHNPSGYTYSAKFLTPDAMEYMSKNGITYNQESGLFTFKDNVLSFDDATKNVTVRLGDVATAHGVEHNALIIDGHNADGSVSRYISAEGHISNQEIPHEIPGDTTPNTVDWGPWNNPADVTHTPEHIAAVDAGVADNIKHDFDGMFGERKGLFGLLGKVPGLESAHMTHPDSGFAHMSVDTVLNSPSGPVNGVGTGVGMSNNKAHEAIIQYLQKTQELSGVKPDAGENMLDYINRAKHILVERGMKG